MTAAFTVRRPLLRHADLERVLHPASIAIVSASPREGSFGERATTNLTDYGGRLYLVNAKYQKLGDRPCFANLSALPESPDCVVICVPREGAEEIVVEAAKVRAGGVILFASGYAETGNLQHPARSAIEVLTTITVAP